MNKRFLAHFFRKNYLWLLLLVISAVVSGYTRMAASLYVQAISDSILENRLNAMLTYVAIGVGLHFVSHLFVATSEFQGQYMGERFAYEARKGLLKHLNIVRYDVLEKYNQGDLQSIFRNDVNISRRMISVLGNNFPQLFMFIFCLHQMLRVNAALTITIMAISITYIIISQGFMRLIRKYETASRKSFGVLSNIILNALEGIDTLKMYRGRDFIMQKLITERKIFNKNTLNSAKIDTFRLVFFNIINNAVLYGCVIYLCFQAINGEMSIGVILMYLSLLRQTLSSINVVFRHLGGVMGAIAAWDRVLTLVELETEESLISMPAMNCISQIDISNVSFGYEKNKLIFEDFSMTLVKGKSYSLKGDSGSGKTTLIKLLLGFYKSNNMEIKLTDNKQVSKITNLLPITSFIPANNNLFNLSIYDNIAMGNEKITRDICMKLAKKIGINEWLQSLPDGLDTIVDANNSNLSGGQAQAICILRALAVDKPLVIMDEPFASLDTQKEQLLIEIINKIKTDRIVLLTSHRLGSVNFSDQEIVLE